MPIVIPKSLPAFDILKKENVFVMPKLRAMTQDIRPIEIAIVNLMPTKIETETQLMRLLGNSSLQVNVTLINTDTYKSKNTPLAHMQKFYKTFDEIKDLHFDGMIITGAPVETMPFEQVAYWEELEKIMDYAENNVTSTIYICWGAQAGLYYHYGIEKHVLPKKCFGVFEHRVLREKNPLVRGFDEVFFAPHSRHTEVRRSDIDKEPRLRVLAQSEEAGVHLLATDSGRQIFVCGHMEYDKNTLRDEYERDVAKGLPIEVPRHYFYDDDPSKDVIFRWRSHANLLFSNWLNYYVYQVTPFELRKL